MRKFLEKIGFLAAGVVNGLLGSGGGLLSLVILRKQAEEDRQDSQQKAGLIQAIQATSLALVWPMCAVSALVYTANGMADWPVVGWVTLGLTLGAAGGIFLLKKMQSKLIDAALALLMLYTGARMLFWG